MAIARSHHQQQRALGKIRPGSLLNGAVSILTSPIANVREEWLEEQACRTRAGFSPQIRQANCN